MEDGRLTEAEEGRIDWLQFVRCDACQWIGRANDYPGHAQKHRSRVTGHNGPAVARQSRTPVVRPSQPDAGHEAAGDDSSAEGVGVRSTDEPASVRSMDATRGYAHPFREQGRFGSHPSHDGYGDEDNA